MSISVEQKMEIARKLVAIPQHYGKNGKINDSHLCEFKSDGEWMVVSVRPIDSGRKTPSIGIYFSDKRKHLQSAKQIGLPDGFQLQEDLITEKSTGWISYGRQGCDTEEEMYREIVNPGARVEAWKGLFDVLKDWAKKEMGCDPIFYAKENDVGIAEALGGVADGTGCENVTTCEYQKMMLSNGGIDGEANDNFVPVKAKDFVEQLRRVKPKIVFSKGELSVLSEWNRHVRYCTDEMSACFGGRIYYEIYSYYSNVFVELHDARGCNDELQKALKRIVEQHSSYYFCQGEIGFCDEVRKIQEGENRSLGCFGNAFSIVESRIKDMLEIFNPFFRQMILSLREGGEKAMQVAAKCYVPDPDILTASEAINKIIDERIELRVGTGQKLEADARDGYFGRFSYQIYKNYFDGGNVHFEVMVRGGVLSVELHDERTAAGGKLRRVLRREAERNGFVVDNDCGLCIRLKHGIAGGRKFHIIRTDVERDMKMLWNAYGELLNGYVEHGEDALQNADAILLPSMEEIPKCQRMDVALGEVNGNDDSTFSWVSTIDDLFCRKPFPLECSNKLLCPIDYVIPVYQRKYAWTEENVSVLCRDLLKAAAEKEPSYHLGTIILHADRESGDFFVVDGQQRLRTISRLLSRKFFREADDSILGRKFTKSDEIRIWRTFMRFGEKDRDAILKMLRKSTVVCIAVGDVSEAFQLFSTQNGRGKPLSPENLLKAFHFHELGQLQIPEDVTNVDKYIESRKDEIDADWERLNGFPLVGEDLNLLGQVVGEHLYRIRCWLHGEFPEIAFSARKVAAFKGLTLGSKAIRKLPVQNLVTLRISHGGAENELATRSIDDKMNPFVFIEQPIANGEDFFEYVKSCCQAYRNLFVINPCEDLVYFRSMYDHYCLYSRSGRRGDTYARHVFQSLCMYCYDRFGADGVTKCFKELYCCAYYERAVSGRCYYQTCGRLFAVRAIQAMASVQTMSDLKDRLCELSFEARDRFDESGADGVDGLEMVYEIFDGGTENV